MTRRTTRRTERTGKRERLPRPRPAGLFALPVFFWQRERSRAWGLSFTGYAPAHPSHAMPGLSFCSTAWRKKRSNLLRRAISMLQSHTGKAATQCSGFPCVPKDEAESSQTSAAVPSSWRLFCAATQPVEGSQRSAIRYGDRCMCTESPPA